MLFSGSALLTKPLIESIEMPLGTVITWFGIIAFQIVSYLIIKIESKIKTTNFYRIILKGSFLFACLWGIIGYFLAGNWGYNFSNINVFVGSEKAASLFWIYSFLLFILPIAILLIYAIHSLIIFVKSLIIKQ